MKMIEAKMPTAKKVEPKWLKQTENDTRDPRTTLPHHKAASSRWQTKSTSPRRSNMPGELTMTTTDNKAMPSNTIGDKAAPSLTTKKDIPNTGAKMCLAGRNIIKRIGIDLPYLMGALLTISERKTLQGCCHGGTQGTSSGRLCGALTQVT